MNGPEHYAEAERLLATAHKPSRTGCTASEAIKSAQVHATLALAAATVEAADQQIDTNYRRALILRPSAGDDVDPAFPGTPWGRALYGVPR